jgi:hypothetical protein
MSWSSGGTPSISLMTASGSGLAKSSMNAHSSAEASRSVSRRASAWMYGRSPAIIRGVNALLTRLRMRRWCAPSWFMIIGTNQS